MKQINNGYAAELYLLEDGTVYDAAKDKMLKPDKRHVHYLRTANNEKKKISLKTLYKQVYGKTYCKDDIEDLEGEVWKVINDTDGLYMISNYARVKSYAGYNAIILKTYKNNKGYDRVDIMEYGKRRTQLIHKLVAAAFLPMPERMDYQIHHKDFNRNNSIWLNLEYLSPAEHAKKHAERRKKEDV